VADALEQFGVAGQLAAVVVSEGADQRVGDLVPAVTVAGIARIVAFQDPGLFGSFGLPREYGAGSPPPPAPGKSGSHALARGDSPESGWSI
jgi:hypothetical protein